MSEIRFGTAGVADDFEELGYKNAFQVPEYLRGFGLNAFEYQCGRGVRLTEKNGNRLGAIGAEQGIQFSLHAPYYISMSGLDDEKRMNSIHYLLQSAAAIKSLGGKRVIFHSGSCGKQSREAALEKALDTMRHAVEAMEEHGYSDIVLCPEVMGKVNQLGTVDEVLALCGVDKRITPCVDFGHLNARTMGGLGCKEDFAAVLDQMQEALGDERAKNFHVHFSKIQYTQGGEKCHLTFADQEYGPNFEPFIELCAERGLTPTIICESAGTQAVDSRAMRQYYDSLKK